MPLIVAILGLIAVAAVMLWEHLSPLSGPAETTATPTAGRGYFPQG